jgi:hypothetical protein
MMNRVTLALSTLAICFARPASAADEPYTCRNMYEGQHADVDGPVLAVKDYGPGPGIDRHYRIVVRDHFTGCRVADLTDTVCKVGQHGAIVGGSLVNWTGDDAKTDTDYVYLGHHQWTCE